ncbi:GntR family transcriptional regulator [Streptomyces ambofaciens ATCC 23877]|uniref:GntR family transcriptional regulator n=1 Tax=Streptomyces ambofaciens (strain ATCC 23877 / 3486 / DSM 40053 / JCM 4204 / NBRC 12836 / NRRL B-2516) TaxID=278992 RepID=A0A0K2AX41_STRA7|nr:PLP-dependent aminotransferase family protein [Streptomyces ambofaciens]AKZ57695.1 GntR family transcriptional regulator [Streptomyces ambofaciens ATCC 23877]
MGKPWATFGVDLHLDRSGRPGLRRGLTDALREAVRGGRLAPGTRLPSSRSLAGDLGVARNTVAEVYADLVAEGWLTARQGSGTRVAERTPATPGRRRPAPSRPAPHRREPAPPAYDLVPGTPELASFPRTRWLRAARRALTAAPDRALGYGDPRGHVELRTALAGYLSRARGVHADPDRIVVCSGFLGGLGVLTDLLHRRGARSLAVESYGLPHHRRLIRRTGLDMPPLPFDDRGTRLPDDPIAAQAVLLTPSHQFPLGLPLLPERRTALIDWARGTGGLVLEDDYDGELRYDRQPVGALQGLDPDRVVYLGTASKSLAPALRLGWLVLPGSLVEEAMDAMAGRIPGVLDQLTLAEFIGSGDYDRHVRAARLRYRRRRDALVAALAERAPEVRVTGIAAGMHAVLRLPPGTEQQFVRAAAWHGLAVQGMSMFRHPEAAVPPLDALVVGYGTPPDHAWTGALDALCRALS